MSASHNLNELLDAIVVFENNSFTPLRLRCTQTDKIYHIAKVHSRWLIPLNRQETEIHLTVSSTTRKEYL